MLPIVPAYVIGVVTAPLVAMAAKPILRGTVKATVGVGLQMKKVAAEARDEVHVLAAEARTDAKKG